MFCYSGLDMTHLNKACSCVNHQLVDWLGTDLPRMTSTERSSYFAPSYHSYIRRLTRVCTYSWERIPRKWMEISQTSWGLDLELVNFKVNPDSRQGTKFYLLMWGSVKLYFKEHRHRERWRIVKSAIISN